MTVKKRGKTKGAEGVPDSKPAKSQKVEGQEAPPFPIVGIGASAGGLAAFEAFFSNMPVDIESGMAFVLVQHLAPDHKSILSELIKRYTRMQVSEVEDGVEVQPNCVYIIPPNRDMAFLNGSLHLLEQSTPRGLRLPIDFFFRSLAQDQQERAICIVLSGTGSDGTAGLRAIKGEGGMVMAQEPESAEYDGMPRSAIATGLVDYVLPPAQMPAQLIAYAEHAFGKKPRPVIAPVGKAEDAMKKIFILLRAQTGHDISQYKQSTVVRRVERRMAVNQIGQLDEYYRYFQKTPSEAEALFRDLLIGVTSFFRDPEAFDILEKEAIPRLFAGKPPGAIVRVWAPGCSTGEEAYSIAILLHEHMEALKQNFVVQVFATDIDSRAIDQARAGSYPASIATDISIERLARFFTLMPDGGSYRIQKSIRDMLVFSEQSVIKDPSFSRLDMISCRNLLIYMGRELQKKLIPLFHYALNPGGLLFLGNSESVGDFENLFATLDRKWKLYQRIEGTSGIHRIGMGKFLPPLTEGPIARRASGKSPGETAIRLRELTERTLLQQYAPASVIINERGDILYIHGRTGRYLEPAPGEAGVNILQMAREGLRRELTTAIRKMAVQKEPVRCPGLRVRTNGDFATVNMTVQPVTGISGDATAPGLLLVTFEEAPPEDHAKPAKAVDVGASAVDADTRVAALEQELRAKEEYLQTTFEEMETSAEELKSTNEEMQSVNEELQSTNEELETSKEELESLNEELATVNAELQGNVSDLSRINNDMNNLIAGTGFGTIFVDHQLRIQRFTPSATLAINLIPGDVGRPVSHVATNLEGYDRLTEDVRAVLDTLIPREIEVMTKTGVWYLMRIAPYRTLENVIEGVVIIFIDITGRKRAEEERRLSEERLWVIIKDTGVTVFNQDAELRYTWIANPLPGFTSEQMLGKTDMDLLPDEDAASLTAIKRQTLESGVGMRKEACITIDGVERFIKLTVEPLRDAAGNIVGITCSSMDITERKRMRELSRESGEKTP